jgi:hypothetical protein
MSTLEFIFQFFKDNWKILKNAPLMCLSLLAIGFTTGAYVAWYMAGRIYEGQITTLNRIIADREQRLQYVPLQHTAYSRLNNIELKQRATNLVKRLRAFIADVNKADHNLLRSEWKVRRNFKSII